MTATPFPDAEAITTTYLRALIGDVPVATDLRGWQAGLARVVLTRTGGVPKLWQRTDYPRIDVDCYAADKGAAHDLAQQTRALLHDMPGATFPTAVICTVEDDTGLTWLPDEDTEAPRYAFAVRLVTRPIP